VPRERSVRLAGLSTPAKRGASTRYRARVGRAARRRLVAGVLVVASLAMITAYFRESDSGAMHTVQDSAATVMQPFQVGADRLVAPFRDAWGYVSDLRTAKSEADKYRKQLESLRAQSFQYADAIHRNRELEALLAYRSSPRFPDDYTSVTAQVISDPLNRFRQQIVIAAGHDQGIRRDYPVVVRAGLVGQVTRVTSDTAQVTLITDQQSTVSAQDAETRARGGIRGQGAGKLLLLDRVPKQEIVKEGDRIVTSGRRYLELPSLYPANIGVGKVESVTQRDIENFATITVKPFVDFSDLDSVLVLIPKEPVSGLPSDDGR
jgi:rod shape-determining protein MreC